MRVFGVLFAVLTIFSAGAGLVLALWRRPQAIFAAEFFGLAWLLGAGAVSALLAIGGIVLSSVGLFGLVLLVTLGLGALAVVRLRGGIRIELGWSGSPGWEKWLCLAALAPVIWFAAATFRDSLNWDGILIWEFKARAAFLAGGSLPARFFSDVTRARYHLTYPLCLPFSELWVYDWVGDSDQTAAKVLFPIYYAAAIALLWSAALRLSGRPWIATLAATVPMFAPLLADRGLGLLQGYADFILATAYFAACSMLLVWRLKRVEGAWPMAAACAALLPWVKQEGIILLCGLMVVAALVHGWRGWKRTILFALPGTATFLVWKMAMRCVRVAENQDFQAFTWTNLQANLPRLKPILAAMGSQFAQCENWSLLWWLAPLALACLAWQRRRETLPLAAALLVPLALDIVPYVFSRLDLAFHIGTSLNRLVLQVSLIAVLCLGLALDFQPPTRRDE